MKNKWTEYHYWWRFQTKGTHKPRFSMQHINRPKKSVSYEEYLTWDAREEYAPEYEPKENET